MPDARVSDDNQFLPRRRYNDQRIIYKYAFVGMFIMCIIYIYIYNIQTEEEKGWDRQRRRHLNLLQLWTRLLVSYIYTCRTNKN